MQRTLIQTYQNTKRTLQDNNVNNSALDARILLQQAADITREDIIINKDKIIDETSYNKLQSYIKRRLKGEPVSRIINNREFYGINFKISNSTLDPRPDTETLIETVLEHKNNLPDNCRIIDLGTGSGCIVLTLLTLIPNSTAIAIDISKTAIKTAKENAAQLNLTNRVNFHCDTWTNPDFYKNTEKFDIVISNPPYIPTKDIDNLEKDVKDFDPLTALDGGKDGLKCYKEIIQILPKILSEKGFCIFEIGYNQAQQVKDLLQQSDFLEVIIKKDLAGNDRCIFTKK